MKFDIQAGMTTVFSGNPLDRADGRRDMADLLAKDLDDPRTRIMLWSGDEMLVDPCGNPKWFSGQALKGTDPDIAIFLGLDRCNAPHWAFTQSDISAFTGPNSSLGDLRASAGQEDVDPNCLAISAQAKSVINWHRTNAYCGQCGGKTEMLRAGYERYCEPCDTRQYPRTDPVVIMLTTYKDQILLGRSPHFPEKVYSALAGFMEPGESIEDAVRRELFEEAGVKADTVKYLGSQPWPWPSSLMIGCEAEATDDALKIDYNELEDARWVSRKEVLLSLDGKSDTLLLPPTFAIARQMVESWAKGQQTNAPEVRLSAFTKIFG